MLAFVLFFGVVITVLAIRQGIRYRRLTNNRLSYSYSELSNNYELWSSFVNPFFDAPARLSEEQYKRTTEEEKIRILMSID
jgi:hypothetical protein